MGIYWWIRDRLRSEVLVYAYWPAFSYKVDGWVETLTRHEFRATAVTGLSLSTQARLRHSPNLWLGYWHSVPPEWLPSRFVFLNSEPIGVAKWAEGSQWFEAIRKSQVVWTYSRPTEAALARLGVPVRYVPFGYTPLYEESFRQHTGASVAEKEVDIFFYGSISPRRARVLADLRDRGFSVVVADREHPAHAAELDRLLAAAKILLGIFYFDDPEAQVADFARFDRALSNGLFVVHEDPAPGTSDPEFAENVVCCSYQQLGSTCAYYLARPEERAKRAAAGQQWFKARYSLDHLVDWREFRSLLHSNPASWEGLDRAGEEERTH